MLLRDQHGPCVAINHINDSDHNSEQLCEHGDVYPESSSVFSQVELITETIRSGTFMTWRQQPTHYITGYNCIISHDIMSW